MQRMSGMTEREREKAKSLALHKQHMILRELRDAKEAASAPVRAAIRKRVMKFTPMGSARAAMQADNDRYVANMETLYAKHKALVSNVPLPDATFNEIMKNIETLLTRNEYKIFEKDMQEIRDERQAENQELTDAYYKDRLNSNFVLIVFAFILPQLMKENIPVAIAGNVVFALNLYTIHLAILYYKIFIDKNTPINKQLNQGKLLSRDIFKEISTPNATPASAPASSTRGYNLSTGLAKTRDYVVNFMNKSDYFKNDPRHCLRFKLFYLSIFIVLLYVSTRFNIDEFASTSRPSNTYPLIGRSAEIALPPNTRFTTIGGKKKTKSKRTIKPKKKA